MLLIIHSNSKSPNELIAATTGLLVNDDRYSPAAENADNNSIRANMPAANLPRSSSVPMSRDSGIRLIMVMNISMNKTMPVNLPSTISVMLIGDDNSRAIEPLRLSSLISRMVNRGVTINSMMLATSKVGITTRSVTPGALGNVASCD